MIIAKAFQDRAEAIEFGISQGLCFHGNLRDFWAITLLRITEITVHCSWSGSTTLLPPLPAVGRHNSQVNRHFRR